jgi:hypothetical protein
MFGALGLDQIDRYVATRANETVQLEFKTISTANFDQRPDRRNLAVSLGGFANSSGGIIVWGIDARKVKEGYVVSKARIAGLANFMMRLHELTGEAISPAIEGVLHKSIPMDDDMGYAATFVPESDSGPHMSKLGEDRYYKRNSDRFLRMEHFDLEDMFGRRPKPVLKLNIQSHDINSDGSESLSFAISNAGRAVAKYPGVLMIFNNVSMLNTVPPVQNISHLNSGRQVIEYSNSINVIHPNGIRTSIGSASFKRIEPADVTFEVTIYCEGQKAAKENYTIRLTSTSGTRGLATSPREDPVHDL